MSNLDQLVQSKAQAWLDGDYDEATKDPTACDIRQDNN